MAALAAFELLAGIGIAPLPGQPILEPAPGEKYLYRLRPGLDTVFSGYSAPARPVRLLTDSRGFRVSPSDVDTASPYEMYVFGDEFVTGEGLEADETFEVEFERVYRNRYKEPYRVHNAGVPGYNLRLSLERVLAQLRTGKPFDWVLVIRDDDLGPAPAPLERSAWSSPIGSRLFHRLGRMATSYAGRSSEGYETLDSLAPLFSELRKLARSGGSLHPCVISVVTDSELHLRVANALVGAARCQRQDVLKQLDTDLARMFQPGTGLLAKDGANDFAMSVLMGLSASFQYRPAQITVDGAPVAGSSAADPASVDNPPPESPKK